jgi:class 3 adenylate cyclase
VPLAPTQYVRSGDADIAYQVVGEGTGDIVVAFDWASHLEEMTQQPYVAELLLALARFGRVLLFDMRGVGMSGPVAGGIAVEGWMEDLVAVMDAAGSSRASIVTHGYATQMGVMAAATHPERVVSLVLINGFARYSRDDDYPVGFPPELREQLLDSIEAGWGTGAIISETIPSHARRPGVREWCGRVERYGATPSVARARMEAIVDLDVRELLPLVRVPTLVVHSRDDNVIRIGHGRHLAEHIAGAELVELDSADHWPPREVAGVIEEFVTGSRSEALGADRFLATVLFVDVVGSTAFASERGDGVWRAALDRFEESVAGALSRYDGVLENTTGDGILATFDGPARAIRCAATIRDDVRLGGLETRCGLHAGEVTRRSDDVAGLAVHIGARVSALAAPGEVLVTRTVRDLVAGSGIAFEERGEHELKGVPDRWALYAVTG